MLGAGVHDGAVWHGQYSIEPIGSPPRAPSNLSSCLMVSLLSSSFF